MSAESGIWNEVEERKNENYDVMIDRVAQSENHGWIGELRMTHPRGISLVLLTRTLHAQ